MSEIIRRYFALASQPDSEAYFALFADDAVVEDEGGRMSVSTPSEPGAPRSHL